MTGSLTDLKVEYLRGALQPFVLRFEKDRPLTIIYGENGTGKSTICDALEFLGRGHIGSLDSRGLGRTGRYWCSHGKRPSDIAVTLRTNNSECVGTMSSSGAVSITPPESRPRIEIFRKLQIRSLVE